MAKKYEVRAKQLITYSFTVEANNKEGVEDALCITPIDSDDQLHNAKITFYGPPVVLEIKEVDK